jgi:hypothetical protein
MSSDSARYLQEKVEIRFDRKKKQTKQRTPHNRSKTLVRQVVFGVVQARVPKNSGTV